MPVSATEPANVTKAGDALRFAGALQRAQLPAVWKTALPQLAGVRRFDLSGINAIDSAGVALLAELAERAGHPALENMPAALDELCGAYRLNRQLAFATPAV